MLHVAHSGATYIQRGRGSSKTFVFRLAESGSNREPTRTVDLSLRQGSVKKIDQVLEQYDKLDAELRAELPLKRVWAVAAQDEE